MSAAEHNRSVTRSQHQHQHQHDQSQPATVSKAKSNRSVSEDRDRERERERDREPPSGYYERRSSRRVVADDLEPRPDVGSSRSAVRYTVEHTPGSGYDDDLAQPQPAASAHAATANSRANSRPHSRSRILNDSASASATASNSRSHDNRTHSRSRDRDRERERERDREREREREREEATSDVEVVEIIKRPGQTLGFYIREGNGIDRREGVFVSRIAYNSALAEDNFLRVGDEIISVNGVQVRNVSLDDVVILMSVPQKLVFEIRRCPLRLANSARGPLANRRTMELRQGGADDSNDSGLSSEHSVRSADQRVRFNERHGVSAAAVYANANHRDHQAPATRARRLEEAASELESSRSRRLRHARATTNGAVTVNHKDYSSDTEVGLGVGFGLGLSDVTYATRPNQSAHRRNHANSHSNNHSHSHGNSHSHNHNHNHNHNHSTILNHNHSHDQNHNHNHNHASSSSLTRNHNQNDRMSRTSSKRSVYEEYERDLSEGGCSTDRPCARNNQLLEFTSSNSNSNSNSNSEDRFAMLRRLQQLRQAQAAITPMQARLLTCETGSNASATANANASARATNGSPLSSPLNKAQQLMLQQQAYDSLLNVQQRIQEQSQPLYATLSRRVPMGGLGQTLLPSAMPAAYQQGIIGLTMPNTIQDANALLQSGGAMMPGMMQGMLPGMQPLGALQTVPQMLQGAGLGVAPLTMHLGNAPVQVPAPTSAAVPAPVPMQAPAQPAPAAPAPAPVPVPVPVAAPAGTAVAAAPTMASSSSGSQLPSAISSPSRSATTGRKGHTHNSVTQTLRTKQIEIARSQLRVNLDEFAPRPSDRISKWGAGRPVGDGLEGQLHVHLYCGRGLQTLSSSGISHPNAQAQYAAAHGGSVQQTVLKDLYVVVELDSVRRTRSAIRTGVDEFEYDEWFEIDLEGARVLTLLLYSWDPDTAQHQHTLHFYGNVSLMHFFQEQRAAQAAGANQAHKVALKLEPKGVLYLDISYRTLFVTLRRQLAALTVVSNSESGAAYLLNGAQVFGVPIESLVKREQARRAESGVSEHDAAHNVPRIVKRCVDEIELRGLDIVGLYRQTGSGRTKQRVREQFERFDSNLVDLSVEAVPDVHIITSLLKDYLRELPEPLFAVSLYRPLLDAMRNFEIHEDDGNAFRSAKLQNHAKLLLGLLDTIPIINQATIMYIMDHLKRVSKRCDTNKMTRANLAVCFGPLLLCPSLSVASNDQCVFEIKKQIDCLRWLLDLWPDMTSNSQNNSSFSTFGAGNALLQQTLGGGLKEDPLYQHPLGTTTSTISDNLRFVDKSSIVSAGTLGRKSRQLSGNAQRTLPRYRSEQSNLMASEQLATGTPHRHDHRRKHHHGARSRSSERPS